LVRVKKQPTRGDLSEKAQSGGKPKSKQRSEEYIKYRAYLSSKEWKEIRKKVLDRDEHRCKCCGRVSGEDNCTLTVHHSRYVKENGDPILYHEDEGDNLKYLITLCSYCHTQGIHKVKANYRRFKRPDE
jgi:5-methylcytosine-specific restriction endonuclease McrA